MLGLSLQDRLQNEQIRHITEIGERIAERRWSFAGYVARLDDERWKRTLLQWKPYQGKRSRGRPRMI